MMRLVQGVPRRSGEVSSEVMAERSEVGSVTLLRSRETAAVGGTGYSWVEDYLGRLDDVEEFREIRARLPWAVG